MAGRRLPGRTALALALAALALAAPAGAGAAGAQGDDPPDLWEAFPLDPPVTTPSQTPAEPRSQAQPDADAGSGTDRRLPPWAIATIGVGLAAMVVGVPAAARSRRRRRAHRELEPPPQVAELPLPTGDAALADLAAAYLVVCAAGSRRPVADLAAQREMALDDARRMLGRARSRGILAGAGRGRTGGELTEKGRALLDGR